MRTGSLKRKGHQAVVVNKYHKFLIKYILMFLIQKKTRQNLLAQNGMEIKRSGMFQKE
jgi:hypothetical protein